MIEFFSNLYHFVVGLLHIGLLGVGLLIATSVFFFLISRMRKSRKQHACKKGLFQLHETTVYDRRASIETRMAEELTDCPEHDGQDDHADDAAATSAAADDDDDPAIATAPADNASPSKPYAVLTFDGDVQASGSEGFARLVNEVVVNKDRLAGAIVVVASPGGGVANYGQLFREMERVRQAGVNLTVCVDTYAASGGYLMSVPAHKIVAAPYAMVGSIGVVSEFVNFHQFLKNLGIEPLTLTAGKYKRTLTPTSEITDEAKQKYLDQLEAIHRLFIASVTKYRKVDPDKACTGDHWTAQESMDLGLNLVDQLATSEEYLLTVNRDNELVFLSEKTNPFERGIFRFLTRLADHLVGRLISRFSGGLRA